MNSRMFKLIKTCSDHYRTLVAEALVNNEFLGDEENCALISHHSGEYSRQWLKLLPSDTKPSELCKSRIIQCLTCSGIEPDVLFVKEDVYYNICNSLEVNAAVAEGCCYVNCEKIASDYIPRMARSVKVSPIRSACDLATEDDGLVLSTYFQHPRYVHMNDVISVPLSICGILRKSAVYHNISEIHFKVSCP